MKIKENILDTIFHHFAVVRNLITISKKGIDEFLIDFAESAPLTGIEPCPDIQPVCPIFDGIFHKNQVRIIRSSDLTKNDPKVRKVFG